MNPNPHCPVCESEDWKVLGSRTYARSAGMDGENKYLQKRMRVLFEIWHPDSEQVVNKSLLCEQCGFVIYAPRPSEDDLDRKYRFLTSLEPDQNEARITPEREDQRARRLWRKMVRYLPIQHGRLLDFGGGDGRLVVPFAEHGFECFVVDYNPSPVDQVTRLGTTLDDISQEERFDLIVCSHVIEHVAEPYLVLAQLRSHLRDGGRIYVEVPLEIWKEPPLHEEPVTHVNFFTVNSLRTLLQRAGFEPLSVKMEDYPHPLGHHTVVISAIGQFRTGVTPAVTYGGAAETRRLLDPPLSARIQRALLRPEDLPHSIFRKLRLHVGK